MNVESTGISEAELRDALKKLAVASDLRFGQVVGLAALIALLPGVESVNEEKVKQLVEHLTKGVPGGQNLTIPAVNIANNVIKAAREAKSASIAGTVGTA
ncbi:MAG: hypothetical protein JF625_02725 [Inquilinus limosus]|uniref:Uncharacterized protein n=1 Tax=Inquilinus limosus TaxID=171674 RepID=A0A952FIW3_9PROT|nr:hypothetical protein [Inquilinus limosus]